MWTVLNQPRGHTCACVRSPRGHCAHAPLDGRGTRSSSGAHSRCRQAGASTHVHVRGAHTLDRVYVVPAPGSLLPAVCGSAVSHTPLFLRNQCMHTVAARARAYASERASERESRRRRRRACTYIHTRETNGKRSQHTSLSSWETVVACLCVRASGCKSAAPSRALKATRASSPLSRASFFEFTATLRATSTLGDIRSICAGAQSRRAGGLLRFNAVWMSISAGTL